MIKTDLLFRRALKPDVLSAVQAGKFIIVIGSYVSYRDVFNIKRRSIIKLVFEPGTLIAGKGIFRPYHKGNRST